MNEFELRAKTLVKALDIEMPLVIPMGFWSVLVLEQFAVRIAQLEKKIQELSPEVS